MRVLSEALELIKAGLAKNQYYKIMNYVYKEAFSDYYMIHFPFYQNDTDDLLQGQKNLTNVCLSLLPSLHDKRVLEVGCGNGVQTLYIKEKYRPSLMVGLDIHEENIKLAESLRDNNGHQNVEFLVSDAQEMAGVESSSFDIIVNIESAMHYPEKDRFFSEIFRILKPGGSYVIADILSKVEDKNIFFRWLERRLDQLYWPLDSYIKGLSRAGLSIDMKKDITSDVLKGFELSSNWFANYTGSGKLRKSLITLFAKIQIAKHKYYLRNFSRYLIFVGKKNSGRQDSINERIIQMGS